MAQVSEEDRKNRCENNKKEIARLEKLIPELEKSREKSKKDNWDDNKAKAARDDYNLVISDIKKLTNDFHPTVAANKGTDKEYLTGLLDLEFEFEKEYTSSEQLIFEVDKDFDDKGRLKGEQPINTIKRLRVIRDAIGKKIDSYAKTGQTSSQKDLDKQVSDAKYMLSYHKNRRIELKCNDDEVKAPAKNDPSRVITPADIPKPSSIELKEITDKYGTFTITMKNTKDDIYEGVYNNNNKKGVFILKSYKDNVFDLQRISGTTAFYGGRINGNTVSGTIITGGLKGTFTATLK